MVRLLTMIEGIQCSLSFIYRVVADIAGGKEAEGV